MSSLDLIAPARLEELLGGAFPETDREARLQGLALELRSEGTPAPEVLRQRVRTLGSAPRKRRVFPRRPLAAVLVAASLAAAVAITVSGLSGDRSGGGEEAGRAVPQELARKLSGEAVGTVTQTGAESSDAPFLPFQPKVVDRAQDIDMWIELRVRDADRVSEAVNEATAITHELGGFVAASSMRSAGQEGRAELALRIPVGKVEEAASRLSQLGTITGQRVVTEDLQGHIDRYASRIAALSRSIRIAELKLASGTLDAEQTLQLQIRLERLRAERAELRRARARVAARAATAEFTLVLHTREAAGAVKEESRIGGAAGDAADFLARAGAVAVFAAIVLSPVLVLVVLAWLLLRSRRRRIETQVLERTRPAAPTTEPRS
jgi:Domain of unknown function (DUF4349)